MINDIIPYEDLANEIIKVAADDYRGVLKALKKDPRNDGLLSEKDSLEYFFRSSWFEMLTNLDGESILHRLMQEQAGKVWFE